MTSSTDKGESFEGHCEMKGGIVDNKRLVVFPYTRRHRKLLPCLPYPDGTWEGSATVLKIQEWRAGRRVRGCAREWGRPIDNRYVGDPKIAIKVKQKEGCTHYRGNTSATVDNNEHVMVTES
jgi:hypothetical protein